jgi:hypothetical protein
LQDADVVRLVLVLAISACSGDLREKIGQSDIDATVLMTIPAPPCDPPATVTDGTGDCTGGGMPGDDCLMCHHQGGATAYTFAGTAYDAMGMTPLGGATIHLQDEVGNTATAVTHANGNFYSVGGFVMYPAKAFATLCPDVMAMVGPVDMSTGANCNTAGCHSAGFRIHIP